MIKKWTMREICYLKRYKSSHGYAKISKKLKRTIRSLRMKAIRLGIVFHKPKWTKAEERLLRRYTQKYMTYTEIGLSMKRSRYSIASKVRRMGL